MKTRRKTRFFQLSICIAHRLSAIAPLGVLLMTGTCLLMSCSDGQLIITGNAPIVSGGDGRVPSLRPMQLERTALILTAEGNGSGTYVDDGLVLTNWHICFDSAWATLPADSASTALPYDDVGAALCDTHADSPSRQVVHACGTPSRCEMYFDARSEDALASESSTIGKVVFADRMLEVCLIEVGEPARARIPTYESILTIDATPVRIGQKVSIAGHPLGQSKRNVQTCQVIETEALIRNPELVSGSKTEVVSFAIDCPAQHGSSGSPVFDVETGMLLGVVWTGVCEEIGKCRPPTYVSAASSWPIRRDALPAERSARLRAFLAAHGVP